MKVRRHPMVVYLNILITASAIAYLLGPTPTSITQLLPGPLVYLWYGTMAVGGAFGLLAAAWPGPLIGILIERAAMIPMGAATIVYAVAVAALGHLTVLLTAGLIAGFGVAALWRAVQITLEVRAGTSQAGDPS